MQIISTDETVRNDTIEDLKKFNSQSLTTQSKKGEQLVSMMPAIKKAFNLLGDDRVEISTENDALKSKIGSYDEKWLEESKNKMLKQIDDEKRANLFMSRMKKQMEKHQFSDPCTIIIVQMAYISYKKMWESEFDGIVSERDKLQDLNINQLKLEVHDTYKKGERLTKKTLKLFDDKDFINKSYLDEKFIKINGHLSNLEKHYNELKLQYNKQNVEDILIQRAVKTTMQVLHDEGLFDNYANADKVLEDFLFTTRRR